MAGGRRVHVFRPGQRGELNVPVRALRLPALSLLARTFICHLRPDQEGHHILLLPFCSFSSSSSLKPALWACAFHLVTRAVGRFSHEQVTVHRLQEVGVCSPVIESNLSSVCSFGERLDADP